MLTHLYPRAGETLLGWICMVLWIVSKKTLLEAYLGFRNLKYWNLNLLNKRMDFGMVK